MSNARLLALPGGNLGVAFGVEGHRGDRSATIGGSHSERHDRLRRHGDRLYQPLERRRRQPRRRVPGAPCIISALPKLAVPVVSPEMHVLAGPSPRCPARRLLRALAATSGSVAKPRVAERPGTWSTASPSAAPGRKGLPRAEPRADQHRRLFAPELEHRLYRCEADLRAGRIANYGAPARRWHQLFDLRQRQSNLKPENSTRWTLGTVAQPKFVPESAGAAVQAQNGILTVQLAPRAYEVNKIPMFLTKEVAPSEITFDTTDIQNVKASYHGVTLTCK